MAALSTRQISRLEKLNTQFDALSLSQKKSLLIELALTKLPSSKLLLRYFDALLFSVAHAPDQNLLSLAEKEILRVTAFLKKNKNKLPKEFINSGLPHCDLNTGFSYDFTKWLSRHPDISVQLNGFPNPQFDLNSSLKLTLPSLERYETTAGNDNDALMHELKVDPKHQLEFLLSETGKVELPYFKDHLWEGIDPYVKIAPRNSSFSKNEIRLSVAGYYFHSDLLKRFDHAVLFESALPLPRKLNDQDRQLAVDTIKNTMAVTARETDPATYMDENTLRIYDLERGISVAIYGMIAERQLPLESYVGFTLFKNGLPASYGGAWVFGKRSNFGINVFESFRGGESGYIMCQLLRVYRQVFGITYFEVEPYQYGLDNPEGIESGAFWFYYRFGFRPVDKKLRALADKEFAKIKANKNYRSSKKTLLQFTQSNIELRFEKKIPTGVYDITPKIKKLIQKQYNGNRARAEKDAVMRFKIKTQWVKPLNTDTQQVMNEVALWAEALDINDAQKLKIMCSMIHAKPLDLYGYQSLLLSFLGETN